MKSKIFTFFFIITMFFSFSVKAEINNIEVLLEFFNTCAREGDNEKLGAQIEYCACATKKVSIGMDFEELMLLGLDMMDAEDERDEQRILLSSQKLRKYVAACASKLYE